ncbi:hypothetical protein ACOMHN_054866 [Nucella lapillus]
MSDNSALEDQSKAADSGCLNDRTAVDSQSTAAETRTQSPSSLGQTSTNALYDADFQNFLMNCFESLSKKTNDDSTVKSQGLILLTSTEMRLPSNTSQGKEGSAEDGQGDTSGLDLPAVDSVWLMNMLRETSRRADGHGMNVAKDTSSHQTSEGDHSLPSSVWLFSGLKSLFLDAESSVVETSAQTKDRHSPQRNHVLPVLPGYAGEVLQTDFPTFPLSSAGQLLGNPVSRAIIATESLSGAADTKDKEDEAIAKRDGANGVSREREISRRATTTRAGMTVATTTTRNREDEAVITLLSGRDRSHPESQSAIESVTLTSTEYGHLVETFLAHLASASNGADLL